MPTALILSPHFPPSTMAGVHRARHLSKGLPVHGWKPVVLHADPRDYIEPGDPGLAALVQSDVEQISVRTLPASLTRPFGIGDIGIRGYQSFARAICRTARSCAPDVVLITGSPFYPFLLSRMIRKRLGLPVVLDFQDPWISAQGANRKKMTKGWASHQLSRWLEPEAVRNASAITTVSEVHTDELRDRYYFLSDLPMASIPIGGDPDDFDTVRSMSTKLTHPLASGKINLSFVGTYMPRTAPVMEVLFRALHNVRCRSPSLSERIHLNFVGTSNQPGNIYEKGPVTHLAEKIGIADMISETPGRVPFVEALTLLAKSDFILLIGSDEPHYTASKIYPALMSGTPYLSIFHEASSAHRILSRAEGGKCFSFESSSDLSELVDTVAAAFEPFLKSKNGLRHCNPATFERYTAQSTAKAFVDVFERLNGSGGN